MNRAEFIRELTDKLSGLPMEERQAAVRYYEEYYEEAGPEREQEIVAELVSPAAVAESILRDYSSVPIVTDRVTYNRQATTDWQQPDGATAQSSQGEQRAAGTSQWERLRAWAEGKMPLWAWIMVLVVVLPVVGGLVTGVLGLAGGLLGGVLGLLVGAVGLVVSLVALVFVAMVAVGLLGVATVLAGLAMVVTGLVSFVANPAAGMLSIGIGALLMSVGLLVTVLGGWIAIRLVPKVINTLIRVTRDVTNHAAAWVRKVGNK